MSRRLVLFSQPTALIMSRLSIDLFPNFITKPVLAYMPSNGADTQTNAKYTPFWVDFARQNRAEFVPVDNSQRGKNAQFEQSKLLSANILLITGGNTFVLLNHLRQSGLDRSILEFWHRPSVVLSGFSAGAIVLTPSIATAKTGAGDADTLGLSDLSGLNIVNFEIWPHYDPSQSPQVASYQTSSHADLKLLSNDDVLVINE